MRKIILHLFLIAAFIPVCTYGQNSFSGSFQSNSNFFIRDSAIGAAGLPQYDNLKIGSDVWFNLNYSNQNIGLEMGVRFDAFLNSILRTPTVPYTGVGLGNFYIKEKIKDFTFSGGYLYDQIATGMIYRAYEERTLGIDNALIGGKAEYENDFVHLKAFMGVQKNVFSIFNPIIAGFNGEANLKAGNATFQPGVGIVNRSMDQASMNTLLNAINSTLDSSQRFIPKYNMYAFAFYNTLTAGPVSWYLEGDYKTRDAIYGIDSAGNSVLINKTGNAFYSTLNISTKGLGAILIFKRIEDFDMRTSANETGIQGLLNFEPPVARENSLRLPSRYFAPSLTQHELAFGTEITWKPVNKLFFVFNGSYIRDFLFEKELLPGHPNFFGEGNVEVHYKPLHVLDLELGFQYVLYNRPIYQGDGLNLPAEYNVNAYTPFFEVTHKLPKKMSYRVELQYQYVPNDFGQWIYGLFEFNVAPHFSVAASDMWNFKPNTNNVDQVYQVQHHFYSIFASYTQGANRFSLNYVKQVAGIVCTGGVCRYEPAFSGVKFSITSTF